MHKSSTNRKDTNVKFGNYNWFGTILDKIICEVVEVENMYKYPLTLLEISLYLACDQDLQQMTTSERLDRHCRLFPPNNVNYYY